MLALQTYTDDFQQSARLSRCLQTRSGSPTLRSCEVEMWRAPIVLLVTALGWGACAKAPSACGALCPSPDVDASAADAPDDAASDAVVLDLPIVEPLGIDGPAPVCGDDDQQFPEECDDGNALSNDGCSADCKAEQRRCPSPSSADFCDVRPVTCGDGVVVAAEACDDGNTQGGDGCAADCLSVEPGWRCRVRGRRCVPVCGDGVLAGGETCDDGNIQDGDGCSSTCLLESALARCGDGVIEGGEECDTGGAGLDGGYGGCTAACLIGAHCGDGKVDVPFEDCDLGPDNVTIYGLAGCTSTCHFPPACGDGKIQNAFEEQCDLGPQNGAPGAFCTRGCHIIIQ